MVLTLLLFCIYVRIKFYELHDGVNFYSSWQMCCQ